MPEFCQAVRFFGLQGHASELARKCWRPLAWFARRTARGFRVVCGGAVRGWNGLGRGAGGRRFSEHVCASGRRRRFGAGSFCRAVRVSGVQGHASGVAGKCWRLGAGAWFARRTARGFRAVCGRRGPGVQGARAVWSGARRRLGPQCFCQGAARDGFSDAYPGRKVCPGGFFGRRTRGFCRRGNRKGAGTQKVCTFLQRKSGFLLNFFAKSDTIILYSFKARDFTESSAFRI